SEPRRQRGLAPLLNNRALEYFWQARQLAKSTTTSGAAAYLHEDDIETPCDCVLNAYWYARPSVSQERSWVEQNVGSRPTVALQAFARAQQKPQVGCRESKTTSRGPQPAVQGIQKVGRERT